MECTVVTQVRGDKNLNYNDRGNEEKGLDFSNFRDQSINQSIKIKPATQKVVIIVLMIA